MLPDFDVAGTMDGLTTVVGLTYAALIPGMAVIIKAAIYKMNNICIQISGTQTGGTNKHPFNLYQSEIRRLKEDKAIIFYDNFINACVVRTM